MHEAVANADLNKSPRRRLHLDLIFDISLLVMASFGICWSATSNQMRYTLRLKENSYVTSSSKISSGSQMWPSFGDRASPLAAPPSPSRLPRGWQNPVHTIDIGDNAYSS